MASRRPSTGGLRISDAQIAERSEAPRPRSPPASAPIRRRARKGGSLGSPRPSGLKVLQGIWLGRNRADNRREIEAALQLARRHPGVVKALHRRQRDAAQGRARSPPRSRPIWRRCKRRSGLPVTYADVWEFWLKSPELASAADFITIHILPYWEDDPVAATEAVAHVREMRDEAAGQVRRQGDLDRRGGLAERGPDARRRAPLARPIRRSC